MKKEREQFFENININDAAMAQVVVEETRSNIEKANKGIKVGLVAMAIMLVIGILPSGYGFLSIISAILQWAWLATLIMTYVWGGGFKQALAIGWKVAKVAWFVVPVFPLDIAIAMGGGRNVHFNGIFFHTCYFCLAV